MQAARKKDGSMASTTLETALRWQEHFCTLFAGRVATCVEELSMQRLTPVVQSGFKPGIGNVERAVAALPRSRAVGRDAVLLESSAQAVGSVFI